MAASIVGVDALTGMPCLAATGLPVNLLQTPDLESGADHATGEDISGLEQLSTLVYAINAQLEECKAVSEGWEATWTGAAGDRVSITPSPMAWTRLADGRVLESVCAACTRHRQRVQAHIAVVHPASSIHVAESVESGISGMQAARSMVLCELAAQFMHRNWAKLSRGTADGRKLGKRFLSKRTLWSAPFRSSVSPGSNAALHLLGWGVTQGLSASCPRRVSPRVASKPNIECLIQLLELPSGVRDSVGAGTAAASGAATLATSHRWSESDSAARDTWHHSTTVTTSRSKRTPVKGLAVGAITTHHKSKMGVDSHAKHLRFDVEDDDKSKPDSAAAAAAAAAAGASIGVSDGIEPAAITGESPRASAAEQCIIALTTVARAIVLKEPRLHTDIPKPRVEPDEGIKDSEGGRGAEAAAPSGTAGRSSSVPASRPGAKHNGWRLPRWVRRIVGGAVEPSETNPRRQSAAPAFSLTATAAAAGSAHSGRDEFTATRTPSSRTKASSRSQSVPRPRKPLGTVAAAEMAPARASCNVAGAQGMVRVHAWSRPAGQTHAVDAVPVWPPRIGGWTWHGEHELPATDAVIRTLAGLDSPLQPWLITNM